MLHPPSYPWPREATITNLKGWKTEPHNENQNERNEEKHEQPSESDFAKLYAEACRIADLLGVEQAWPRYMCRKPAQRELYSSVVDFYKNNIFVPFLDTMIHQLETRLVQSEPYFRATRLLPSKLDFSLSDDEIVKHLSPIFSSDSPYYDDILEHGHFDTVTTKLGNWITRWRNKPGKPKHMLQTLNSLNIDLFPNIKVVVIHFLTLPVTTCSVERAFSEMRLLKTWLRSTMTDERLSSLALMHLNYDLELPYEELIKKWSQCKDRLIMFDIYEWMDGWT